jgi:HD-like signal output (HDOD) protein
MGLFRTEPPPAVKPPEAPEKPVPTMVKPPAVVGWPEEELIEVYNAAPAIYLKRGEALFAESPGTDSFFVVFDGALEVTVTLNGLPGSPAVFQTGDCLAPLLQYPGLSYHTAAATNCTVVEISRSALKQLPMEAQIAVYKAATSSTGKIQAYIHASNGEIRSKNLKLSQYVLNQSAARNAAIQSDFVQGFVRKMRRLPLYATDLAAKLLDDRTSVQEIVEGIRSDPNLVALVLRTVNSAHYGFSKKIESFYHACMVLGFNNIHNLLMREAAQSTMPITRETARLHKHSCLMSILCFELIGNDSEHQSQTAMTIGLLHDLGKGVQVVMKNGNPLKAEFVNTLDSAKLGSSLLRTWGIPERICKIVEFQQHPEFMLPDLISPEYRRELAALHVAHILETILTHKAVDPTKSIYTADHMAVLGFRNISPADLLTERVLPSLDRNRLRIPPEIQSMVLRHPVNY